MAKQAGIIKLTGSIDGLNFYYLKGKPVVRKSGGGFNGKRIRKEKRYARVRENASEFGHCSSTKKWFRLALGDFLTRFKDPGRHARLMRLFAQIKDLDLTHERGQRRFHHGVLQPKGIRLLEDFAFTPESSLSDTLGDRGNWDQLNKCYTVHPKVFNHAPGWDGSTHFGLEVGYWKLDPEARKSAHVLGKSEVYPVENPPGTLSIPLDPPETHGLSMVLVLLQAYQEINGKLYKLSGNTSVILETVYCAQP